MFFKKSEPKCMIAPSCHFICGMIVAFGIVACTKSGRKFIKNKMDSLGSKLENCPAMSS